MTSTNHTDTCSYCEKHITKNGGLWVDGRGVRQCQGNMNSNFKLGSHRPKGGK